MILPNIVLYFTDQQRWDTLGCYGQKLPVSPCLDALAEELKKEMERAGERPCVMIP